MARFEPAAHFQSAVALRQAAAADVWVPAPPAAELPAAKGQSDTGGSGAHPAGESSPAHSASDGLPVPAKFFVASVIAAGAFILVTNIPTTFPAPGRSLGMLTLVIMSSWLKVHLPVGKGSATLSVSFVADFLAMLLLGPQQAIVLAGVGAVGQCVLNRPTRGITAYRVVFSAAALMVTMQATSLTYMALGGQAGVMVPQDLAKSVVGGATAYFLGNTILVATATALATRRSPLAVWHDAFLWSAPSYFLGGAVAAAAAWLIGQGDAWFAPIVVAPTYLTYRTYKVYLGRIEDERRHAEEVTTMHEQTVRALDLARRSEQALAVEKERLAVTLGSIGEAVIATDTRSRIVLLNKSAEAFTGWCQDRAMGRLVTDVMRLADRETGKICSNPVDKVVRTREGIEHDSTSSVVALDGTMRLVDLSAMPIRDENGTLVAVAVVLRDTTDAKRLEEERLRASKLASLGVLAGGIAHDFNNILTAIIGNISLAQMEEGSDVLRESLSEAERACTRARALTQQLLTFSKGGAPVRKTVFLGDVIREATAFSLHGSNVRCELDVPADLWAVDADEGQIVQVLNNLVINAAQAMPDGGVVDVKAINTHSASSADGAIRSEVRIEVRDHGVGIPEANQAKIFDPYFTTKKSGHGLGLATCYSIIRNHGGRIEVHSTVGKGTTMVVVLPANESAGRQVKADAAVPQVRGRGRVLVMDDEPQIRNLSRIMLGRLGYRVDAVEDGRAAIDLYAKAKSEGDGFDVVIMDLTVPGGIGGKDAIKAILEVDPGAVAIVSSGYADDPVMASFKEYGFKGVVPKPFTVADLSGAVQQLIG